MLSRSWPFTKWVANAGVEIGANLNVEEDQANRAAVPDPKEILFLSVPDLLTTVKQFLMPEKHEQLDQILQRYMQKELGKQQVRSSSWAVRLCVHPHMPSLARVLRDTFTDSSPSTSSPLQFQIELRSVAGREALQCALLAMVPQIDEISKKRREWMKQQQQQQATKSIAGQPEDQANNAVEVDQTNCAAVPVSQLLDMPPEMRPASSRTDCFGTTPGEENSKKNATALVAASMQAFQRGRAREPGLTGIESWRELRPQAKPVGRLSIEQVERFLLPPQTESVGRLSIEHVERFLLA